MSRLLMTTAVPIRVNYLGLRISPALRGVIEAQAERLKAHAKLVENCELHVGNWQLHQNAGHQYRVSLEIELAGGRGELVMTRQSPLNASADVLPQALQDTFDESLQRLQQTL